MSFIIHQTDRYNEIKLYYMHLFLALKLIKIAYKEDDIILAFEFNSARLIKFKN